jgi:hypothetical protein
LRDERGPRERAGTCGRVGDSDPPAILETRCELAIRIAAFGERENAAQTSARDVDLANH